MVQGRQRFPCPALNTQPSASRSAAFTPPGLLLQFVNFFDASALVQFSLYSSPASRQSVCRYERCGPVIGSSFVTQSSGSFLGLSDAGGTSASLSLSDVIRGSSFPRTLLDAGKWSAPTYEAEFRTRRSEATAATGRRATPMPNSCSLDPKE